MKSSVIRSDYPRRPAWTLAEAADFAAVNVYSVKKWLSPSGARRASHGRLIMPFKIANHVGPLKVDARTFKLWITTGQPHGEPVKNHRREEAAT